MDKNLNTPLHFLKKTLKMIGWFLLAILIFLIAYIAIGYALSLMQVDAEAGTPDEMSIYILTNGVHTDIVVPTKTPTIDWSKKVSPARTHAKTDTLEYVAMGWGDKGFYLETPTWAELKASVAFKAAFGLSTTAMHVTYLNKPVENEQCKKINISIEQYKRLVAFMDDTFQKKDGQYIWIDTDVVYGKNDAFFEAHGTYSLFKTCNAWSNKALKKAGQKACVWTALDTGIFSKYE